MIPTAPRTSARRMPFPRTAAILGLMMLAALGARSAAAGSPQPPPPTGGANVSRLPIRPVSGDIQIDGRLDDAGWANALEISDFYEFRPGDGIPAKVRTVVKLAYDADHLYMSARCFDPQPSQILAHLTDRDHFYDDDYIGIELDTFLDHRTGYEFFTNPLGIQGDIAVSNGGNEDDSFDCLWKSAARIDSLGWTAEISIPTKSIRFRNVPITEWGFWVFRNYPRNTRYQLASHKMNRGDPCWQCQFDHLDSLSGLQAGKNLEVLPYLTQSSVGARTQFGSPLQHSSDTRVGLSLKYGITPSLTLDGTVHPDFAQVEADQEQIDQNNQAALFYTEKRPFFLEGSAIFQGIGNWFYSRAITDPEWATKLTGRQGPFQVGVLAARDRRTQIIYPYLSGSSAIELYQPGTQTPVPSTDVVLRLREDLLRDSNIGFTGTSRTYGPGGDGHNLVAAVDGMIRFQKNWRWIWYGGVSRTRDLAGIVDVPDADTLFRDSTGYVGYQEIWYTDRHYNGDVWYTRKTSGYRADLGYQPENDLSLLETWQDVEESPAGKLVDYYQPSIYTAYQKDGRGHLVDAMLKPEFFLRLKHQWSFDAFAQIRRSRRESADHTAFIDTSRMVYNFNVQKRGSGLLVPSGTIRLADDIILSELRLGSSVTWSGELDIRPGTNMLVNLEGQHFNLKDKETGEQVVRQDLGLLRMTYQFTPRLYLRLLSQLVWTTQPGIEASKDLSSQALLSYKLNYATVFFLGLNGDFGNTFTDALGDPDIRPGITQTANQVFAKFQYFWRY